VHPFKGAGHAAQLNHLLIPVHAGQDLFGIALPVKVADLLRCGDGLCKVGQVVQPLGARGDGGPVDGAGVLWFGPAAPEPIQPDSGAVRLLVSAHVALTGSKDHHAVLRVNEAVGGPTFQHGPDGVLFCHERFLLLSHFAGKQAFHMVYGYYIGIIWEGPASNYFRLYK
jgi:hypothetical protein